MRLVFACCKIDDEAAQLGRNQRVGGGGGGGPRSCRLEATSGRVFECEIGFAVGSNGFVLQQIAMWRRAHMIARSPSNGCHG